MMRCICILYTGKSHFSPGGEGGIGKKKMEFIWVSDYGQVWGADYENRCYTANIRGLQPRFHEKASFS